VPFAELTAYRAHAPLAVGWRLKLVDACSGQIVWAAALLGTLPDR
jgi:hypothetical protein